MDINKSITIPVWAIIAVAIIVLLIMGTYYGYNKLKEDYTDLGFRMGYDQALLDIVNKVITTGGIQINIMETNQSIQLVPAPS